MFHLCFMFVSLFITRVSLFSLKKYKNVIVTDTPLSRSFPFIFSILHFLHKFSKTVVAAKHSDHCLIHVMSRKKAIRCKQYNTRKVYKLNYLPKQRSCNWNHYIWVWYFFVFSWLISHENYFTDKDTLYLINIAKQWTMQ